MSDRPDSDDSPRGPLLWRSLEELADTDEFRDRLVREFPSEAPDILDPATRRQFLRVMGASIALAGVSGCAYQAPEQIVPYVIQPDRLKPGVARFFATAVPLCGFGAGVLVETHEGRPTKIEGNPDHPASLGAADSFMQASVLDLYDPDRSQVVTRNGRVSTWDVFLAYFEQLRPKLVASKGKGLRLLTGTVTSPTLASQMRGLMDEFPEARWHVHEPTDAGAGRAAAKQVFGREVDFVRHFDKADVIVSLDCDFLSWGPAHVREGRDFGLRRDPSSGMNRLYVAEPAPTITGTMADSRLAVPAGDVASLALAIAGGIDGHELRADAPHADWVSRVVADLMAHRGKSLVLAGETQPAQVQAIALALNATLGNMGTTLTKVEPIAASPSTADQSSSLRSLAKDLASGAVSLLVIAGVNPAYDAPGEASFARLLDGLDETVTTTIHLGLHADETARVCQWHVPEAHFLETWGDIRAFDGTTTIQQPMIRTMYGGKTALELISAMRARPEPSAFDLVRDHWRGVFKDDFEAKWRASLHDGQVADSRSKEVEAEAVPLSSLLTAPAGALRRGMEITFRPDATIWDGRFSNNGWLQELPKPLTKLTWDNAARLSPATAARLDLKTEQVVELSHKGRTLRAAVWIDPGHADDSVTLSLGYGRTNAGKLGSGQGFNAYALRTFDDPWIGDGLEIKATKATYALATTQKHHNMLGRDLVKAATIEDFLKEPKFAEDEGAHNPLSLYPGHPYDGYKWGMVINLNACIGCSACVTACQSENNISVVGKDQVIAGREMHWIRVDGYYAGGDENRPEAMYHQPVPCMHCENAPCELVCPVNATVHDDEGLNVMVYNRCVGTRYCSNNCPYKVRHFNFLQYSDWDTESRKLQYNPDVTVRSRGVMEKCTYCTQRIVENRIRAEEENRPLRDGEVKTACQATCPTQAIVFGDLNDKTSAVSRAKADPRNYSLIPELNVRPRTTYLAKLTNPPTSDQV